MPDRPTAATVPIWNAVEHLQKLLADLDATGSDLPIVFVDNASTDGAQDLLDEVCGANDRYTLIRNAENLGFTAAINQGLVAIGPGYDVLFLNSDIRLGPMVDGEVQLDPEWLDKLSSWLDRVPEAGLVSPRLQNRHGYLCGPEAYLADDGRAWLSHVGPNDRGQFTRTRFVEDVQHACVLKSAEAIAATGLLEEKMVIYRSDSYDCRTIPAYANRRILIAGDVTVTHFVGASRASASFNESGWSARDQRTFMQLLPAVRPYRAAVNVAGPFGERTGYSKLCENVARSLRAVGVEVLGQPLRGGLREDTVNCPMIQDIVDREPDDSCQTLIVSPPHEANYYRGSKKTCATMFEMWRTPPEWIPILNGWDAMWTFTDWNQQSFEQGGVSVPIEVVPVPLDIDLYHPNLTPMRLRQGREFQALFLFEWGVRKAPESILQVCRTFAGHDDVGVTCRINGHDGGTRLVEMLGQLPHRDVPVMTPEPVAEYDMGSFYRAHDVVVAVGAEGIGLACLEALACGVPVIALNWGPGKEFASKYGALLVDPAGERDVTGMIGPLYEGATVGVPDFNHLSRLIQWVYHNRERAKADAIESSALVHAQCNMESCGAAYSELLFGGDA